MSGNITYVFYAIDNPLSRAQRDAVAKLSRRCSVAKHRKIYFHWRPVLADPEDDMVLELAVAAEQAWIVTFNTTHFRDAEQFGIRVKAMPKVRDAEPTKQDRL